MTPPASLNDYLDHVRDLRFEWGVHDCVQFARGAVEAQGGDCPVPEYRGQRGALALSRRMCVVTYLDRVLVRCPHVPPVGSIVLVRDGDQWRLGVVVSDKAAFVSSAGLVFARLRPESDLYWTVR